jgi:hypothetical protein
VVVTTSPGGISEGLKAEATNTYDTISARELARWRPNPLHQLRHLLGC